MLRTGPAVALVVLAALVVCKHVAAAPVAELACGADSILSCDPDHCCDDDGAGGVYGRTLCPTTCCGKMCPAGGGDVASAGAAAPACDADSILSCDPDHCCDDDGAGGVYGRTLCPTTCCGKTCPAAGGGMALPVAAARRKGPVAGAHWARIDVGRTDVGAGAAKAQRIGVSPNPRARSRRWSWRCWWWCTPEPEPEPVFNWQDKCPWACKGGIFGWGASQPDCCPEQGGGQCDASCRPCCNPNWSGR